MKGPPLILGHFVPARKVTPTEKERETRACAQWICTVAQRTTARRDAKVPCFSASPSKRPLRLQANYRHSVFPVPKVFIYAEWIFISATRASEGDAGGGPLAIVSFAVSFETFKSFAANVAGTLRSRGVSISRVNISLSVLCGVHTRRRDSLIPDGAPSSRFQSRASGLSRSV